ncbi:MAG TPA: hypothetical protein VF647_09860 [Longimicrobium sp.]|jgi:hypothetical protein
MAETSFFLHPDTLCGILRDEAESRGLRVIVRRWGHPGECREVAPGELCEILREHKYDEIYLSVGAVPRRAGDTSFLDSGEEDILVVSGGRMRGTVLEQGTLRELAKNTRARPAYSALRKSISQRSAGQGVTARGSRYAGVFYDEPARGMELREDLDDDSIVYQVEPGG